MTFLVINFLDDSIVMISGMSMLFLPPIVTLIGVLLGIGAIVLRESLIKSIIAIVLNIIYIFTYYNFFELDVEIIHTNKDINMLTP